jgi:hypothetical protein
MYYPFKVRQSVLRVLVTFGNIKKEEKDLNDF